MKTISFREVLFFVVGAILGAWLHGCNNGTDGYQNKGSKTEIKYDHVKDSVINHAPKITAVIKTPVPVKVDTAAILEKYYQKVAYIDTVRTKYGFVYIHDTVHQNHLMPRQIFTDDQVPLISTTITVKDPPRTQLFFGLGGSGGVGVPMAVGPSLMLKTKRGPVYEIGAQINTRSQWVVSGSAKFLIHLK
jgi:hypothetical protein